MSHPAQSGISDDDLNDWEIAAAEVARVDRNTSMKINADWLRRMLQELMAWRDGSLRLS